jgi:hypothetical protein
VRISNLCREDCDRRSKVSDTLGNHRANATASPSDAVTVAALWGSPSAPFAELMSVSKYGNGRHRMPLHICYSSPPYFFGAVRSFGEYGAERDEERPTCSFSSQEFLAKKPANIGDFRDWNSGRRDLPRGHWRRRRYWQLTLSACKLLILMGSHFDAVRIPRANPRCFSEVLFLFIPWITRPSLARQFQRSSSRSPRGWLSHPDRLRRQRWRRGRPRTNIQVGPPNGG